MTKLSRAARSLGAAGLTLALLGLASPAQAERYSIDDPADTKGSHNDVYGLTYVHGDKRVRFVIQMDDLRPSTGGSILLYLDTKPADKGPEYVLASGLGAGTDYVLERVSGWQGSLFDPLKCDHRLALRYKTDKVVGSIARKCLKNPETVAGAVRMFDPGNGTDWVPARKTFGLAVAAG